MRSHGLLAGFTPAVWLVTALTAVGGLLVASVVKHTNTVLKTYASGVWPGVDPRTCGSPPPRCLAASLWRPLPPCCLAAARTSGSPLPAALLPPC